MKIRQLGAVWAIAGITLIIGSAIIRLTPHVLDAFRDGLTSIQWAVLVVWSMMMLIGEGYRGFQKQFAPRVAARMQCLVDSGRPFDFAMAPLYCVGYYAAIRRRVVSSWLLTAGIVVLIVIVRQFSQPWRGIVDTGVVLGLVYGLIAVYVFAWLIFSGRATTFDPQLPTNATAKRH